MADIFASPHVDVRAGDASSQLRDRLAAAGIATFDGIDTRAAALAMVRAISTVVTHRDSDPDGVTVITEAGDDDRPGYAAFTNRELRPHTEGSTLPRPPTLLTMTCLRPAISGGESLLIDGRAVHADLAAADPDAVCALAAPRCAYFGGASGHLGAVFESAERGAVSIRLRLDELVRFAPDAARAVQRLKPLIARHQHTLRLRAGQGYIIQNGRWLHGRTRFCGDRLMLRILSHPRQPSPIRYGFHPAHT